MLAVEIHLAKFAPPFTFVNVSCVFDADATGVGTEGGEGNQQEEGAVPPSVEDIARGYDEEVLQPQVLEDEPVETEDHG